MGQVQHLCPKDDGSGHARQVASFPRDDPGALHLGTCWCHKAAGWGCWRQGSEGGFASQLGLLSFASTMLLSSILKEKQLHTKLVTDNLALKMP